MNIELHDQSLMVVNPSAGSNGAWSMADRIRGDFAVPAIDITQFFALVNNFSNDRFAEMLKSITNIFVLGGDGSVLSVVNLLLAQNIEHEITVTPIGVGGENVVSKSTGVFNHIYSSLLAVFRGEETKRVITPLVIENNGNNDTAVWNFHLGFSSLVLEEIEKLRASGINNSIRRYLATLRILTSLDKIKPVNIYHDGTTYSCLDAGVINSTVPWWTSKVRFELGDSPAMLLLLEESERLDEDKFLFTLQFALEVIYLSLSRYLPQSVLDRVYKPKLVKQIPLNGNFRVEFLSSSMQYFIDSERIDAVTGTMTSVSLGKQNNTVFLSE